ncbi:MAG TPA: DUF4350 domain-containing protein, partial [Roseiflexaceae bacterium]|nr:DUF4350 domain-containing protein [Roseiflexaceae bacterium]
MKGQRDLLLVIGLFGTLILFIALGPSRSQPADAPDAPTSYAAGRGGAYAFFNWVAQMEYDARRLEYRAFELSSDDDMLVMLNPSEPVTRDEAREVITWIEDGGILILADDTPAFMGPPNAVLDELEVDIRVYSTTATIARSAPLQPALDRPAVAEAEVRAGRMVVPRVHSYAAILGEPDAAVLIGMQRGRGYAYISSSVYPFTNAGLRNPENARVVLNLLRRVPYGGRIVFDEYHHGRVAPPSSTGLLFSSPWGWAAAYAGAAVAFYLGMSGRRFGRPVPLREETTRRSSAEYVESVADLLQRGSKRAFVQQHYREQFKRRLGRRYAISAQLDDETFVRDLARAIPINETDLRALLWRLAQ